MLKLFKFIKISVFIIAIISFSGFLVYPKHIGYLTARLNIINAILIMLCLAALVVNEVMDVEFRKSIVLNIKYILFIFLFSYLFIFLQKYIFTQKGEYIILTAFTFPLFFIYNDLFFNKINPGKSIILGTLLLIPTLIYFNFIYVPYESYSYSGLPIIFVHFRIRNWICYIGIALIITSILKLMNNKKEQI